MDSILSTVGSWLSNGLNTILDPFLGNLFRGVAQFLLNIAIIAYNGLTKCSLATLIQTPDSWEAGIGWNVATSINNIFIAIGATLAIIFWCISMIKLSVEQRGTVKIETVFKPFVMLTAAELVITNSLNIITAFFRLTNNIIQMIIPNGNLTMSIPSSITEQLQNANVIESIVITLLSLFFLVGAVATGGSILYFTYIRFFKVLLIIPYGAVSSSYIAGGQGISHSTLTYYKYVFSVSMEAVTMLLALNISMFVISNDITINITEGVNDPVVLICLWMIRAIILMFVSLGAIKESSPITQKGLGM